MENTRRSFLKKMTAAGIGTAGLALSSNAAATVTTETSAEKKKNPAGKDDGKLRFGFIGTGSRCHEHINNVLSIPGNKIVAICDIQAGPIQRTLDHIAKFNVPAPKVYTGSEREFEKMLNNEEFDCVIIASPWEWHVPMSVAAMKAGVPYVGVEVSAANTLEECWDLVNVSEATGSHLNIMENVCYRRDCMAALNMVRKGLFGELLHATCGYEHDLRDVKFNDGKHYTYQKGGELRMGKDAFAEAQWRTNHSVRRNGDVYPTHGIGPVANCLDINRGNRFLSLSAMATQSRGLHKFIVDNGGENHPLAKAESFTPDDLQNYVEILHGDVTVPSLSVMGRARPQEDQHAKKKIRIYERGSQFDLLCQVPDTFMRVSPMPQEVLDRHGLVQRRCDVVDLCMCDILIYPEGYRLSELDEAFVRQVEQERDEIVQRREKE